MTLAGIDVTVPVDAVDGITVVGAAGTVSLGLPFAERAEDAVAALGLGGCQYLSAEEFDKYSPSQLDLLTLTKAERSPDSRRCRSIPLHSPVWARQHQWHLSLQWTSL
ncbi:hypothetical protein Lxx19870 [Leifsonia xyli subsp. xyli str. CTCB07]|uniref:Uncharacterized protein n=1 Tax=Leifsonia xyli subsp. xyli (strain CTCB07) TaxID=281090 RepID=Q6AD42_LEIXX|nr:hypothetical protein Lxx19870 [Leifsonia xyli subsp. xyli str. CTCB07]